MVAHKKPTVSDALDFLRVVKKTYQNNPEIYDSFMEIMKDFKAQRVDTCCVVSRVKELFKGQPELLLSFNIFLPRGYEIILENDQIPPKKFLHFPDAISYINKVKTRLQDQHVFKSFLDLLDAYEKENKSLAQVYHEVAILFRDHEDLLVEFLHYLPR